MITVVRFHFSIFPHDRILLITLSLYHVMIVSFSKTPPRPTVILDGRSSVDRHRSWHPRRPCWRPVVSSRVPRGIETKSWSKSELNRQRRRCKVKEVWCKVMIGEVRGEGSIRSRVESEWGRGHGTGQNGQGGGGKEGE